MKKLDKTALYVFFENHKRNGWLNNYFARCVRKDAKNISKKTNSKLEIVNHVGFLFYDNQWKVAELDYFVGGRIIRNVTENDIKDFQIYHITTINKDIIQTIHNLFIDNHQRQNWWYSLRRYNFWKSIEYIKNSSFKRRKWDLIKLRVLGIFSRIFTYYNAGCTCIETIFYILDTYQCNPFKTKLSPYELLIELNEIHPQKRQQAL